jgi:hypothetical protein
MINIKNRRIITSFLAIFLMANMVIAQDKSYSGIYSVPDNTGFSYASDRSFGENFVFEKNGLSVYLIKEPLPANKKNQNSQIYSCLMDLYSIGFYQEKGSSTSYRLNFLDSKKGRFTRFGRPKGLDSNEKAYLLFFSSGEKLYRIIVYANSGETQLPKEARAFLESIGLSY